MRRLRSGRPMRRIHAQRGSAARAGPGGGVAGRFRAAKHSGSKQRAGVPALRAFLRRRHGEIFRRSWSLASSGHCRRSAPRASHVERSRARVRWRNATCGSINSNALVHVRTRSPGRDRAVRCGSPANAGAADVSEPQRSRAHKALTASSAAARTSSRWDSSPTQSGNLTRRALTSSVTAMAEPHRPRVVPVGELWRGM